MGQYFGPRFWGGGGGEFFRARLKYTVDRGTSHTAHTRARPYRLLTDRPTQGLNFLMRKGCLASSR